MHLCSTEVFAGRKYIGVTKDLFKSTRYFQIALYNTKKHNLMTASDYAVYSQLQHKRAFTFNRKPINMEWTAFSRANTSKPSTAFTSFSHAVRLSTTKGVITRSGIHTIGEHGPTRVPQRPRARDYEILNKAFIELSEESEVLRKEHEQCSKQLLSIKEQYLSLSSEHQQLKEKYEQLQHLEEWGRIIRGKDEDLRRLHEYIRKMSYDRTDALNHKTVADVTIDELKSKLRKKDKEVKDIKAQEKVQIKAKVLGETEKLRNERDLALANLYRQEQLAEKERVEVGQMQKISEERKMVIHVIQKKMASKEKHIEELRKQLIVARLFNK